MHRYRGLKDLEEHSRRDLFEEHGGGAKRRKRRLKGSVWLPEHSGGPSESLSSRTVLLSLQAEVERDTLGRPADAVAHDRLQAQNAAMAAVARALLIRKITGPPSADLQD